MTAEAPMKLYVWHDVLCDYTAGVMFALASSAEEARAAVLENCPQVDRAELASEPTAYETTVGFAVWGGGG